MGPGAAAGAAGVGAGVPAAGAGIPGLAGAAGAVGWAGVCPGLPGGGALGFGAGGFWSSPVNRLMATRVCLVVGSATASLTPSSRMAAKPTTYGVTLLMISSRGLTFLPAWPLPVRERLETRRP